MSDLGAQPEKPAPILATLTCTTCNGVARVRVDGAHREEGEARVLELVKVHAGQCAGRVRVERKGGQRVELDVDEEEGPRRCGVRRAGHLDH